MKYIYFELRSSGSTSLYVRNNIIQVDFEAYDRGMLEGIVEYGVFANRGTVSFFDYENAFFELNKQINSGSIDIASLECYIWLSSNFRSKGIGAFSVDSYTYNEDTKEVIIQLKDPLLRWQDIPTLRHFIFNTTSLFDIFITYIEEYATLDYNVTESARGVLEDIQIYCPDIEADTLWGVMTKICEASGCRIYTNADGIPEISFDSSLKTSDIVIRPYHILSINNKVARYKAKIENPAITVKQRTKQTDVVVSDTVTFQAFEWLGATSNRGYYVGYDKTRNPNADIEEHGDNTLNLYGATARINFSPKGIVYRAKKAHSFGYKYFFPKPAIPVEASYLESDNAEVPYTLISHEISDNKITAALFSLGLLQWSTTNHDGYLYAQTATYLVGDNYFDDDDIVTMFDDEKTANILNSNNLMQKKNTWEGADYSEYFTLHVANRFLYGVECCEMECILNDYYDDNGNLILDASGYNKEPQIFSKYDVVVPYVIRKGIEVPYRTSNDGTPMRFLVTGIKYSYNGFLRQTLRLMEYA